MLQYISIEILAHDDDREREVEEEEIVFKNENKCLLENKER